MIQDSISGFETQNVLKVQMMGNVERKLFQRHFYSCKGLSDRLLSILSEVVKNVFSPPEAIYYSQRFTTGSTKRNKLKSK